MKSGSINSPPLLSEPTSDEKREPLSCQRRTFCVGFWFILVWSVMFAGYIVAAFLSQPPDTWRSIQDFGSAYRPYLIGPHFVCGAIVSIVGPLQLLACIRQRCMEYHRWAGRLFVICALITCVGGCSFVMAYGTVGGLPMDIVFVAYGTMFAAATVLAWKHARAKDIGSHRAWAIRAFALAVASAVYRILVFPLFVQPRNQCHGCGFLPYDGEVLWLNIAAWLFVPVSLIPAELYLRAAPWTDTKPLREAPPV
jgi:hypothetical protein